MGGGSHHIPEGSMERQDLHWTQRIFKVMRKKGIFRGRKDRGSVPDAETCLRCMLPENWVVVEQNCRPPARKEPCFLPQTSALHPELHPPEPVCILHPPSAVRLHQRRGPQMDVQHGPPAAPMGWAPLLPGVWCFLRSLGRDGQSVKTSFPNPTQAWHKERQELPTPGP